MYFVIVAFFTLISLFHNTSPISLRDLDSIQRAWLFNNHPLNFPGKKLIIKRSGPNFESVQVISSSSSIIPNSLNKEETPSLFDSNAFPLSSFTKAIDEIENNFIRKATLMDKLIHNPNEQKVEVKSLSNMNSRKVNINHNNSNNNNNISKVMSHKMTEQFMKNESDIQVINNTEKNLINTDSEDMRAFILEPFYTSLRTISVYQNGEYYKDALEGVKVIPFIENINEPDKVYVMPCGDNLPVITSGKHITGVKVTDIIGMIWDKRGTLVTSTDIEAGVQNNDFDKWTNYVNNFSVREMCDKGSNASVFVAHDASGATTAIAFDEESDT